MARSRLPLSVSAGGASSSRRACSSLSAGVSPSLAFVTRGRFTPFTGLCTTALRSQRYSNSDATAESLRRIVEPSQPLPSNSLRQAIRWARVTTRNTSGFLIWVVLENSNVEKLASNLYLSVHTLPQEDYHDTDDASAGEVYPILVSESTVCALQPPRQRQHRASIVDRHTQTY